MTWDLIMPIINGHYVLYVTHSQLIGLAPPVEGARSTACDTSQRSTTCARLRGIE